MCISLEQVDDGQGQILERETFLMQVTRDGDLIYDHGRPQRIHPVEFESGRAEVRDGKLDLPGSKLRPKVKAKARRRQVVRLPGRSGQPGLPGGFGRSRE